VNVDMRHELQVVAVRSRPAYAVDVIGHPAGKYSALVGLGTALLMASVVLAAAVAVTLVGVAWIAAGSQTVQRAIDRRRENELRRERRMFRERRMMRAGVQTLGLIELSALVDGIEGDRDGSITQYELDDLLDHYVALAVAHERCLAALRATDRIGLARQLGHLPNDASEATRCRRALIERRIACWDRCQTRAQQLEDELAATVDLVRLIAQRAACPDDPLELGAVARRLAELDLEDAALAQLEATATAS
jgi:hypothetical protein